MHRGGELIREARLRAGLTQKELSELTGRERSVIARWEQGVISPPVDSLIEIIQACADLFDKVGYHHATMQMLADEVGVGKPTLYHYFRSKTAILYEMHQLHMDALLGGLKAHTEAKLPASEALKRAHPEFHSDALDIRDADAVERLFATHAGSIAVVVHTAAQPSHDWAARDPVTDFSVNAQGTLVLLEATRAHAPDATFIFTSTNKVYGDTPNRLPLVEQATRWEIASDHAYAARGIAAADIGASGRLEVPGQGPGAVSPAGVSHGAGFTQAPREPARSAALP